MLTRDLFAVADLVCITFVCPHSEFYRVIGQQFSPRHVECLTRAITSKVASL